jgi:allantoinase
MFLPDLVVRSRRTVLEAAVRPSAIHVRRGKIIGVMDFDDTPEGCPIDDAGDAVLMPGVVDTHVHVQIPDSDHDDGETFTAATRAAATGGITTIVVMPVDATPSKKLAAYGAAAGKCVTDVGFWGAVTPGGAAELNAMVTAGVLGFSCRLAPTSVGGLPFLTETDLRAVMPTISKLGLPLLVHAELPRRVERSATHHWPGWLSRLTGAASGQPKYATHLAAHPKEAENEGIALAINLCRDYRTRTHILHLSSSDALTPLHRARLARLPVTAETCPHYLMLVAEDIPDGAPTFLCDPPIRERANREYLWASLAGGLIQMVTSNHPCVSTLQLSLAATWTEANARGYSLSQLVEWMCRAPARLAGLGRKGEIAVGFDADLVIWSPDVDFIADGAYAGRRLNGRVERTYLRGSLIYERGAAAPPPTGALLEGPNH